MTENLNIIFFGTHKFAATILEHLLHAQNITVKAVITRPDSLVGRKQLTQESAVSILAKKHDLTLHKPQTLKSFDLPNTELAIVAQYGAIIPETILNVPKCGVINIHTSLLPKYRGASPIQHALINGDKKTGVTIMKMDIGLDTGAIIYQKELDIDENDTYESLDVKLAILANQALDESISKYTSGELLPTPQDDSQATSCKKLTRDSGKIDWHSDNTQIYNQFRGLTPWPGIWSTWKNKRIKLIDIIKSDKNLEPGKILVENKKLYIGCQKGSIEINKIQLEGKKEMSTETFISGYGKKIHQAILGI